VNDAITARGSAEVDFHTCKIGESGADSLLQKKKFVPFARNIGTNPDATLSWDPANDPSHPNHGDETHETHDFGYNSTRQWHSNSTNYTNKASGRVYDDTNAGAYHTSHEKHAHSEEHEKCQALNNTVRTFTNKVKKQDETAICVERPAWVGDGADYFGFYKGIETSKTWFKEMDQFDQEETANYLDQRYECHLARERHIARRAECSRLQTAFETASCAEANLIDETCHMYKGCYTTTKAEWETIKGQVEKKEKQMKRQQHALLILRCYGNEMMAGNTDLSNCNDVTCDKPCDDLDIEYKVPHVEKPCDEDCQTYRPCGEFWWNTNYGEYLNSDTPVCDCVECAAPTLVDFDIKLH
jgi:hypothetical protein